MTATDERSPRRPPQPLGVVARVGSVGRSRLRRSVRNGALGARLTAHRRALPSAVVVGVQRGGTTALANWLDAHPRLFIGRRKEIHHFDHRRLRSSSWYRSHFPHRDEVAACDGVVLDATPSYMWRPYAVPRMAATLPSARVVVSLRDPVERALSHFSARQHWKLAGRDPATTATFDHAVDEAFAWLEDPTNRHELDMVGAPLPAAMLDRGRYASQLERLLRFYPREQVLVIKAEDMFSDPEPVFHRVLDHLGLERINLPAYGAANASSSGATMSSATRARLTEYFRPEVERLPRLLGEDIGW